MFRILSAVMLSATVALATSAAFAQAPKKPKLSPGEMAAVDQAKNERRAKCQKQAREQKIALLKRRAFVRECTK